MRGEAGTKTSLRQKTSRQDVGQPNSHGSTPLGCGAQGAGQGLPSLHLLPANYLTPTPTFNITPLLGFIIFFIFI